MPPAAIVSAPLPGHVATADEWVGFHAALLTLLAAELAYARFVRRRAGAEAGQRRVSLAATGMWLTAALVFAAIIAQVDSATAATQFLAGYAIEQALSIDNLFVFLLLFGVFQIAPPAQPRVLFWGVLGAIVMRGAFVAGGVELLERFHWVGYVFAALLLMAAIRLLIPEKDGEEETGHVPRWVRWVSRIHPVSLRTDIFFTRENGTRMVTLLFLALIAIELTDVVFALDSIPAVLSITRDPFLAYTSNILAVMGLRSLFFLLAEALKRLRYLHYGLAGVLLFAAGKMLAEDVYPVGPLVSLAVVAGILGITIGLSLARDKYRTHMV